MKAKLFFPLLFCVATTLLFTACQPPAVNPDAANEALVKPMTEMILDIWNNGNMAQLEQLYAPDFTRRDIGGTAKGYDEFKASFENIKKTYSNFKLTLKESWVKGDKVTFVWNVSSTHSGPFGEGMPATGKPVSIDGVSILTLKDGKVVDDWAVFDQASVLTQVGYTFQPPATAATTSEPTPVK
ncbi:MAG: ester cyclase [Bacteroidetes bacterium]|nr:ester cyclase [Bacteroidota bacterium]